MLVLGFAPAACGAVMLVVVVLFEPDAVLFGAPLSVSESLRLTGCTEPLLQEPDTFLDPVIGLVTPAGPEALPSVCSLSPPRAVFAAPEPVFRFWIFATISSCSFCVAAI